MIFESPGWFFWIAVAGVLVSILVLLFLIFRSVFARVPKFTREDCPHFNVDGDGMCNLLPDPEPCGGYCRTLASYRRED